jgi:hypothetical protein
VIITHPDPFAAPSARIESNGRLVYARPVLACEEYIVRDGRIATIRMLWHDPMPVAEAAGLAARG